MSDPIEKLKRELAHATPAADPARKAEILARAQESFRQAQGNPGGARPMGDRPQGTGFIERIRTMLAHASRPGALGALGATTAIVAIGLVLGLPVLREGLAPPAGDLSLDEAAPATIGRIAPEPVPRPIAAPPAPPETPLQPAPETAESLARDTFARTQAASPGAAPQMAQKAAPAVGGLAAPMAEPLADRREPAGVAPPEADTETYANAEVSPLHVTAEDPVSTFSVDVDTASWAIVRAMLKIGQLPPPEAVRIEEMVNYFPYDYAAPDPGGAPFRPTVDVMTTPWNPGTRLLRIGLQGRMPAIADRPPLNLVFLIDTSGSMNQPDKLPLLIQSFRMMLAELRPEDEVAIVTYAGSAGVALEPVAAGDREAIEAALKRLTAQGSTAGQAGLEEAYALAERMTGDGEVSRVLLATDGDFNVGIFDPERLKNFIAEKRRSGIYLSVLGFGRGNLDDATMQALAQNGNGTAAYVDTLSEARKVLVDQLTGTLFPIANDVKVQVEFNPATVAEYRLIGYETRALRRQDFANDRVDAGEIGAGHQVTALYEITPVGSAAALTEPLRYGSAERPGGPDDEFGFLRLRWKAPGDTASQLLEQPIGTTTGAGNADFQFAAAIAGFGQILRGGAHVGDWSIGDAVALAEAATGTDRFGYRREAVDLMRIAETLDR